MCKNQEEMLKELREEVVLNVLLNNESEFEEYFTCLSSNIDYICHLLDKAEIEVKTGFKVKECYSPSNEFDIRTVYAFVIEEYKHVSIDAILYICFDECEGEVVSVGLERITTLQEVKEKFLKYEEDLIFKIMAVKCYEDYKLEMFSDEKIVINIETLEDVPF